MPRDDAEKPAAQNHLYLVGEITDQVTQEILSRVLADWDREYVLFINSDGGSSSNALALVNLLKLHGRIDTVCLGVALSGAADTLAAGRRRWVVPTAVAMIHQISFDMGNAFTANLVRNAQYVDRLNDQFAEMLARDTRQSKEQLLQDMLNDHYLFGREILDYGLADELLDAAALSSILSRPRVSRRVREPAERTRHR